MCQQANLLGKCNFLASCNSRFAPESDRLLHCREMSLWAMSGCEQSQQSSSLFDHLVGGGDQRWRHGQAEHLGGLEVDHQLEARRLFYWEIARIGARHNFGNVPCGAPILFAKVCPIRDETSHIGKFSKSKYCRKPVLQREFRKLLFIKDHERVGEYNDALPMVVDHCGKSFINPAR